MPSFSSKKIQNDQIRRRSVLKKSGILGIMFSKISLKANKESDICIQSKDNQCKLVFTLFIIRWMHVFFAFFFNH